MTVQAVILFPIILVFIAICYDYMLYINAKTAFIRGINEFKLELNAQLNQASTESINSNLEFKELSPQIRQAKSLFDNWHLGMNSSNLEEILKKMLTERLKINIDRIEELKVEFHGGFLKNRCEISYRIRMNGIFKFVRNFGGVLDPDFRVLKGSFRVYQENIYMDIIHIDMIATKIKNWDKFDQFMSNFKSKIEDVANSI